MELSIPGAKVRRNESSSYLNNAYSVDSTITKQTPLVLILTRSTEVTTIADRTGCQ